VTIVVDVECDGETHPVEIDSTGVSIPVHDIEFEETEVMLGGEPTVCYDILTTFQREPLLVLMRLNLLSYEGWQQLSLDYIQHALDQMVGAQGVLFEEEEAVRQLSFYLRLLRTKLGKPLDQNRIQSSISLAHEIQDYWMTHDSGIPEENLFEALYEAAKCLGWLNYALGAGKDGFDAMVVQGLEQVFWNGILTVANMSQKAIWNFSMYEEQEPEIPKQEEARWQLEHTIEFIERGLEL